MSWWSSAWYALLELPFSSGMAIMPRMSELPAELAGLPVVILTSKADDADHRRGLDAGADAYVVKSAFDEQALLDVVARLLGGAAAVGAPSTSADGGPR